MAARRQSNNGPRRGPGAKLRSQNYAYSSGGRDNAQGGFGWNVLVLPPNRPSLAWWPDDDFRPIVGDIDVWMVALPAVSSSPLQAFTDTEDLPVVAATVALDEGYWWRSGFIEPSVQFAAINSEQDVLPVFTLINEEIWQTFRSADPAQPPAVWFDDDFLGVVVPPVFPDRGVDGGRKPPFLRRRKEENLREQRMVAEYLQSLENQAKASARAAKKIAKEREPLTEPMVEAASNEQLVSITANVVAAISERELAQKEYRRRYLAAFTVLAMIH